MGTEKEARFERAITAAFGIAIVLLLLRALWVISASQATHREAARYHASQDAAAAAKRVDQVCAKLERTAAAACIAETIKTTRQDQRAEYELAAQEDAAEWALWAVLGALGSVIVSSAALYLLLSSVRQGRQALEQAQEANKITQGMVELENRPIIEFIGFRMEEFGKRPAGHGMALLTPNFRNIGRMPAIIDRTDTWRSYHWGNAPPEEIDRLMAKHPSQRTTPSQVVAVNGIFQGASVSVVENHPDLDEHRERLSRRLAVIPPELRQKIPLTSMVLLVAARATYRAAIGISKEWSTQQVVSVIPYFDEAGVLRIDDFGTGPPERLTMT
ncbi:MAG TPA: hypothetical protein VHM92_03010 [Allosphingosinicella sp.]|nr:hypothetical protein [Allosphingosinicella sp.]